MDKDEDSFADSDPQAYLDDEITSEDTYETLTSDGSIDLDEVLESEGEVDFQQDFEAVLTRTTDKWQVDKGYVASRSTEWESQLMMRILLAAAY